MNFENRLANIRPGFDKMPAFDINHKSKEVEFTTNQGKFAVNFHFERYSYLVLIGQVIPMFVL